MKAKELVETIRKIVRQEIKSTVVPSLAKLVKPIIQEAVENQINKVLAEQYIKSLNQQTNTIVENVSVSPKTKNNLDKYEKEKETFRKKKLEQLGVKENPMLAYIMEDIDVPSDVSPTQLPNGMIQDDDSEGVDLSRFGL